MQNWSVCVRASMRARTQNKFVYACVNARAHIFCTCVCLLTMSRCINVCMHVLMHVRKLACGFLIVYVSIMCGYVST